ncbi:aminotransferase class V-fold PLP-dependent enzyme [Aestuariibacter salexigens]|uniref:aminotransferase class V-fold PLP-dependent enzyme n=1 Tax=Aestuariibacter salexigens TaxID=226010 RepID=UPI00041C118F|nr:aminotransferase class V-fold PLP-dependent enzyme [Aestuariibacter salexigens]
MFQTFYRRFLEANPGVQHFACHSHYYWPDITRQAMLDYWDDSARFVDDKWDYWFSEKIPAVQQHIARVLNTEQPEQIVFAPNTHEFVFRLMTCLPFDRPISILTTDSEFHSFNRQSRRFEELANVTVHRVPAAPFETFNQRFEQALASQHYDMVFLSHVFFNSGVQVDALPQLVNAVQDDDTMVVIDGYHAFMAVPVDLSEIKHRVFYLAGGYKYAQGGEGGCFMHVPKGSAQRPLYTGWFAEFGELSQSKGNEVSYSKDAMRFAGSTMDFSALYRLHSVFELFAEHRLDVRQIDGFIKQRQQQFLTHIDGLHSPWLNRQRLIQHDAQLHGHFLAFELDNEQQVGKLQAYLHAHNIATDGRGKRLRFGFALYHDGLQYDLSCIKEFSGE